MRDHGRGMAGNKGRESVQPGSARVAAAAAGQVAGGSGLMPKTPGSAPEPVPETAAPAPAGGAGPGAQSGPARSALDAEIRGELMDPYGGPALQHVPRDAPATAGSGQGSPVRSN